nr:hypothetical protein [Tanacetum cinerariifolium]
MSTYTTHQQSLADASSETRPSMLERGPYEFKDFTPSDFEPPRLQTEDDLIEDDLKRYEAEIKVSHDPLALVSHKGSSSKNPSPYYVTHPSSVVVYDDDYQGDEFQNNSEVLLIFAMIQNFGNDGKNSQHSFVPEEITEGNNVQNNARNIQRTLRTTSLGSAANVQCYNCSEKDHYARNYPKPKVRDSKYFMEQMLLAKQDEAGVGDLSLESIEDEEAATVDEVFEGAFWALGLEAEALVDAMEVYGG